MPGYFRRFVKNNAGRDFVVGDLHGHLEMFDQLLKAVNFDRGVDRIFSVGDLIDRGPYSVGCMKLNYEPWFYAVMGNHEDMMLRSQAGDRSAPHHHKLWMMNGGKWWEGVDKETQEELVLLATIMPLAMEVKTDVGLVGIVHAAPLPGPWEVTREALTNETADEVWGALSKHLLWDRELARALNNPCVLSDVYCDGVAAVFIGHTPQGQHKCKENIYLIDTNVHGLGGVLTAVQLTNRFPVTQVRRNWDGEFEAARKNAFLS